VRITGVNENNTRGVCVGWGRGIIGSFQFVTKSIDLLGGNVWQLRREMRGRGKHSP